MRHWERVRVGLKCSYGCEIRHSEWAYMRGRFAICEPCANKHGITRPVSSTPVDATDPAQMVPASAPRRGFTDVGALAANLQASDPATLVNQVRRLRRKR